MEKETILVVEDNPQIAQFMTGKLLPELGYSTLHAGAGQAALDILGKKPVSLVLLDLQLPDMTGLDVLRKMASRGQSIPTILVTAHGSEQVAVESFRLGVQDYLIKPVDPVRLQEAISKALTETRLRQEKDALAARLRAQLNSETVLAQVGQSLTTSLELDEVLRRIVDAGVHLTQAEEGFLALLEQNTDRLFVRAARNIDQERAKTIRLPVNDPNLSQALRSGKPLRATTRAPEEPLIKVSTGFLVHSVLYVPIFSRGKALGVLTMDNPTSNKPFQEKDEMLLTSLAGYAAIAIENAALYQRAQSEINERKRIEEALRESDERYALAVRGSKDGLWDWDLRQNRLYFSPRWKAMLGYNDSEIRSHPDEWFRRVHPEDLVNLQLGINNHISGNTPYLEAEYRILHKDGKHRWMLSRGQAVWDEHGKASRIAGSQTEITDRKTAEERLIHYAYYDELTGLPNRALFLDRLTMAISRAKRHPSQKFAVLFLDLDHFKDVNDTLGHMMGDQLLIAVGQVLLTRMRTTDTVARLGGDEFVILLEELKNSEDVTDIADWILEALAGPYDLQGNEIFLTASIGVVFSETGYSRPDDILRDADIAMYHAKSQGKARFEVFDPTLRYRIMERHDLITDLRRAIEHHELRVYYQIITSLKDGAVRGVEALVRWEHPTRGLLLPKDFIPVAEETGIIIAIDRWVLREACYQLRRWQTEFSALAKMTISVNMSSRQMVRSDLVDFVKGILEETGVDPGRLHLEVTENVIVENRELTIEVSNRLRALGTQIHIDDFGIGYSSLGYISHLPVNALKIDRSFIHNMNEDEHEMSIVHTILTLSKKLGVDAIAEGVESEKHLVQLAQLGCDFAQGFYLSPPLPSDELQKLLTRVVSTSPKPD